MMEYGEEFKVSAAFLTIEYSLPPLGQGVSDPDSPIYVMNGARNMIPLANQEGDHFGYLFRLTGPPQRDAAFQELDILRR